MVRLVLVVRTHNPTAEQAARVAQWSREVERLGCQVVVSIDVTNGGLQKRATIEKLMRDKGLMESATIHSYTQSDMLERYPGLHEFKSDVGMSKIREMREGKYSLAWGFHCCALGIWFQSLLEGEKPDFVLKMEDDVGFSGTMDTFVEYVMQKEFDHIDLFADTFKEAGRDWWWIHTVSKTFNERVPIDDRVQCREHVQRFSKPFLNEIDRLGREDKMLAWSEQSLPTICDYLKLKREQISKDFVSPFYFMYDSRVNSMEWERICKSDSPRWKGKLYHALKF